jgi:hypothetical protein
MSAVAAVPSPIGPADDRLLSIRQLVKLAGVSEWFLRQEVTAGRIPVIRLSARALRIRASAWAAYLASRETSEPRTPAPQSPPVRKRSTVKSRGRSA